MDTHRLPVRQTAIITLTLLAVAFAGCAVLDTGGGPSGPPDAETVEQRYQNLTGVTGVVNSTIRYDNGTIQTKRIHQRYNPQTRYIRSRVIGPAGPDVGDVFAFNGTTIWEYDASRNEVTRIAYSGQRRQVQTNKVMTAPQVFRFLQAKSTVTVSNDRNEKINPLPAVPITQQPSTNWVAQNESYTIQYLGTATVSNRKTHVVSLTASGQWVRNRTIYYDARWFYPIKSTVSVDGPSSSYRITARYEYISFNPGLTSQDFSFTPPASAELITRSQGPKIRDTYSELSDRAAIPVPDAEFPSSFTFQRGYEHINGMQILSYANGKGKEFTIAKFENSDVISTVRSEYDPERIETCGVPVYYIDHGDSKEVVWKQDLPEYGPSTPPKQYRVWGNVSRETLIEVVRSIEC